MFNVKMNGHPGYLPAGTHRVKIRGARKRTAKSGNPQLELELEALDGEHKGKIVRSWITDAPGTELFWEYFAKAAFPEATGSSIQFQPQDLIDREVVIKVEWPDDSEWAKVTHYYPVAEEERPDASWSSISEVRRAIGVAGEADEQTERDSG